jgi:hypothetical protein
MINAVPEKANDQQSLDARVVINISRASCQATDADECGPVRSNFAPVKQTIGPWHICPKTKGIGARPSNV